MWNELDKQALDILTLNDRGGYTIPTDGLYPFQWNWDSAFVALGFATFDVDRAWVELESLMEGQWENGFLPHIVFRKEDDRYFPGPLEWGTEDMHEIATSGISQPPVLATIARQIYENNRVTLDTRARALFPKMLSWHRWFHTHRDPQNTGLIAVAHPWESGRDNLPDWDKPLANMDITGLEPYQRKDLNHVDSDMRPGAFDYDRYVSLVRFGKAHRWDRDKIAQNNPFWVADVGQTSILLRADRDLLAMAKAFGFKEAVTEIEGWIGKAEAGYSQLWNDEAKAFTALDLRTGEQSNYVNGGTFLAFYAGMASEEQAGHLIDKMDAWWKKCRYGVSSFDPYHEEFDSVRYWRGPVWAVVNWLVARGMADEGYVDRALHIRHNTQELIEKSGFRENFCPVTGMGCGGHDFSWTAAIWLDWLSPSHARAVAA